MSSYYNKETGVFDEGAYEMEQLKRELDNDAKQERAIQEAFEAAGVDPKKEMLCKECLLILEYDDDLIFEEDGVFSSCCDAEIENVEEEEE